MHLQEQTGTQSSFGERLWQSDHRALDDIGSAALQRRVDRLAFGVPATRGVLVGDTRHPKGSAEWCLSVAADACLSLGPFHIRADARIPDEICIDVGSRLAWRNTSCRARPKPLMP